MIARRSVKDLPRVDRDGDTMSGCRRFVVQVESIDFALQIIWMTCDALASDSRRSSMERATNDWSYDSEGPIPSLRRSAKSCSALLS
ncbi:MULTISPECIES: hypothetical protein [Burkholderia]|uniref:hypothetical protein n=1 Tax=Burkholderia sp. GbtcB21 TaxID=2824766 RepID=UPI000500D0D4|nr:hypothetical protein [Burkholderia sp. GbtcB21]KFL53951.1 hypothetical protein JM78_10550 [Burkholderia pyrrocinia]